MQNRIGVNIKITAELSVSVCIPVIFLHSIWMVFHSVILPDMECEITVEIESETVVLSWKDRRVRSNVNEWLFQFLTLIEDYAVQSYQGCVYHGSAVARGDGSAIAFMGPSGAGKTTIVSNVVKNYSEYIRISDDLLLLENRKLLPIWLPMKEKSLHNSQSNYQVTETFDGHRFIAKINMLKINRKEFFVKAIVYIKFRKEHNENSIRELKGIDCLSSLIKNSRKAANNRQLAENVVHIMSDVPMYELNYSYIMGL